MIERLPDAISELRRGDAIPSRKEPVEEFQELRPSRVRGQGCGTLGYSGCIHAAVDVRVISSARSQASDAETVA